VRRCSICGSRSIESSSSSCAGTSPASQCCRRTVAVIALLTLLGFSIFSWRQMQIVADLNHRGCLAFTYLVEAGHG